MRVNALAYNDGKEKLMSQYPLAEQKLVYRVLHRHLTEFPELMDSEFLHDLQRALQKQAQAEGVDVADHAPGTNGWATRRSVVKSASAAAAPFSGRASHLHVSGRRRADRR